MVFSELMMDGLDLMVIGMGTVFVFLSVLVASVTLMSKVAHKLAPHVDEPVHIPADHIPAAPAQAGVPAAHVAAIAGAVHQHKAQN